MIEDELIKIWQSSNNQERVKFEKSKLMIELQSSLGRLHRWWKYIELFEVVLAVFGILVGVFAIFKVPFVLVKVAIGLIIILAIILIIKYKSVRGFKPSDLEDNYLDYLEKNRQYLEIQKKFLKTYLYWGILPAYPIMLLCNIAVWEKAPIHLMVFNNVAAIAIGIYGYFLNKKRIKNEINPRIVRVDELIKELKE